MDLLFTIRSNFSSFIIYNHVTTIIISYSRITNIIIINIKVPPCCTHSLYCTPPKSQKKKSHYQPTMGVHIFGKSIKHNALVRIGLAKRIFGVGYKTAQEICAKVGIYPRMRMNQLTEPQIMAINKELSDLTIEGHLKQSILENIQQKRAIGSYAGGRHAAGLPVRGQRTRNNASIAKRLNRLDRKL